MTAQEPTFWPLDGRVGWRTAEIHNASLGRTSGLRLGANPDGPLSLTWPDDSLGGITLPSGMAFDAEGTLYLLDLEPPFRIRRFEPHQDLQKARFVRLRGVGGQGAEARRFESPGNLAIAGRDLYVADSGNRRVQVFALPSLALRHVWGPPQHNWRPVDVAGRGKNAYILDGQNNRVFRHTTGRDGLVLLCEARAGERWSRLAVDRQGGLALLDSSDPARPRLDLYDAKGKLTGSVHDANEVRERFEPPAVRLFIDQRQTGPSDQPGTLFCLPESLIRMCNRQAPANAPGVETPLSLCLGGAGAGLMFDRRGQPVKKDPAELVDAPRYASHGIWISQALDSQIYRCQWHRVEIDFPELPPGCQAIFSTYTADEDFSRPYPASPLWQVGCVTTGEMQPPPGDAGVLYGRYSAQTQLPDDFLVQSRAGQYLWLKIELRGDGFGTPVVQGLRVHYPRQSYLEYLPAVFAGDDESRWFLERFLSIFQTEWDRLEQRIQDTPILADPAAVPAGPFLDQLARWVGLPLEGGWTWEQRRNLLMAVRKFYPQRGTLAGLRAYLQAYLQNISGMTPSEQGDYPQVVEGFRERQRVLLNETGERGEGHLQRLWSPAQVGRMQLGVYSRAGEVRLVTTGNPPGDMLDPLHDLFNQYAHRFRVYVPAAWIQTKEQERMLRRALETEKPAHTAYELCLVEPRFRVGVQSMVGVDTIVGDYPQVRLNCYNCTENERERPGHAPSGRLGYDTVLGGRPLEPPDLPLKIATVLS